LPIYTDISPTCYPADDRSCNNKKAAVKAFRKKTKLKNADFLFTQTILQP